MDHRASQKREWNGNENQKEMERGSPLSCVLFSKTAIV